jgi:hypothetical protein
MSARPSQAKEPSWMPSPCQMLVGVKSVDVRACFLRSHSMLQQQHCRNASFTSYRSTLRAAACGVYTLMTYFHWIFSIQLSS